MRLGLRFAGEAMREALLAPFEHLAVGGTAGEPDLRISVFDAASTGVEAPPPPWAAAEAAPGTNPLARCARIAACVLAAAGDRRDHRGRARRGTAIFHLPDAARISADRASGAAARGAAAADGAHGRWMTHAGAVGRDGRGVLLVGRGGSGKSTLALSCALAGMEIVADDYVLLEPGPPAWPMRCSRRRS